MSNYFIDENTFINEFKERIEKRYIVKFENSTTRQKYNVLGEMVSEVIAKDWLNTKEKLSDGSLKEVYYFSM